MKRGYFSNVYPHLDGVTAKKHNTMTKELIEIHKSINKRLQTSYFARYIAKNGEILSNTETETRKANVKKNIRAMAKIFEHKGDIRVMDYTLKKPKEIYI